LSVLRIFWLSKQAKILICCQAGSFARLVALGKQPAELRGLYEIAREEPAITRVFLAAANGAQYSNGGSACMNVHEAVQTLGVATSLNIALGLTLRSEAELQDPELILMAQEQFGQSQSLCRRLADLATACRIDPAPLHSAALLHRMGELCVLAQPSSGVIKDTAYLWKT
jgi:HD-like signal output (HDOD) protein